MNGSLPITGLLAALLSGAPCVAETAPQPRKIYVAAEGAHKVSFEDLDLVEPVPSAGLGLTNAGAPVPIWIEDGGDGALDPGDWIEFVGRHLPGEIGYFNEFTDLNVYLLGFDHRDPARTRGVPQPPLAAARSRYPFRSFQHAERDRLLLRFSPKEGTRPEIWYWAKLSQADKAPFGHKLRLDELDLRSGRPVSLRLHFRGWSAPAVSGERQLADHRVEVSLNGQPVASGEWNADEEYLLEVPQVPPEVLRPGDNQLTVTVPRRTPPGSEADDPLIDVLLLNYLEVDYPRLPVVGEEPVRLEADPRAIRGPARLVTRGERPFVVHFSSGHRLASSEMPVRRPAARGRVAYLFTPPAGGDDGETLYVVPEEAFLAPESVEADLPSSLTAAANRADYIMIAHPRLKRAIEPLAEMHRRRGLVVEVVDIRDVYDEFNHGILHPRAIRDFLAHAYHRWAKPRPRFVLLVGDASWDTKNPAANPRNYAAWTWKPEHGARLTRNRITPYPETASLNDRNLIPTWSVPGWQGQAASDNWFVAVDGDDPDAEMAIGRLPVVEPEEVEAIVRKTVRYVEEPEVGPWRRSTLWISNEIFTFQDWSNGVAAQMSELGYRDVKVYPDPERVANARQQEALGKALAEGQLLVHFAGHGGRFIWRTGVPDFQDQQDLFTLEDLESLPETRRLPLVLSLSCYSAPFDHPSADSIGEKFLRLADRGAVAVLGASWRNTPTRYFSTLLIESLLAEETIGEAVGSAKRRLQRPDLSEVYNLLGDPAVPLARPRLAIDLRVEPEGDSAWSLTGELDAAEFSGRAIIEWLDAEGGLLGSREIELAAPRFETTEPWPPSDEIASVRVYAWSEKAGVDGIGAIELPPVTEDR